MATGLLYHPLSPRIPEIARFVVGGVISKVVFASEMAVLLSTLFTLSVETI